MNPPSAMKDPVGLHTLEMIAKADQFNRWMYDQFKHQLKGEILEIGSGMIMLIFFKLNFFMWRQGCRGYLHDQLMVETSDALSLQNIYRQHTDGVCPVSTKYLSVKIIQRFHFSKRKPLLISFPLAFNLGSILYRHGNGVA